MFVVGTILSAINQGGVFLAGEARWTTWVRIALNYVVPFIVSSIGFYLGERAVWQNGRSATPRKGHEPRTEGR
jgi:hypothetical protein